MVPVTVVEAGPCVVVQIKTEEKDSYNAVQLGLEEVKKKKLVNKPLEGHFVRAGINPQRYLREIRIDAGEEEEYQVGQVLKADLFRKGERVDVTGTSKGKGFCRGDQTPWFPARAMAHGSMYHRRPGSLGAQIRREYLKDGSYPGGWVAAGHHSRSLRWSGRPSLLLQKGQFRGKKRQPASD